MPGRRVRRNRLAIVRASDTSLSDAVTVGTGPSACVARRRSAFDVCPWASTAAATVRT